MSDNDNVADDMLVGATNVLVNSAMGLIDEGASPQTVINALFSAVITVGHETKVQPAKLEAAFRHTGKLVFDVYAQRDKIVRESRDK